MGNTKFLSVFFLFYLLKTFNVVSAQPSSFFNKNCIEALSYLASNVSEDQSRYSNLAVGQGLNKVYALGMCTPGTERDTCSRCIMSGSINVTRKCSKQPKAFLYVPLQNTYCLVRYSNRSFGSRDMFPVGKKIEISQNLPSNSNLSSEFIGAWEALMICAKDKAILVVHDRLSRADYFAIDARPFIDGLIMYAFMLCSKDISPYECGNCLGQSINEFNATFPGKPGRIQRPSCFMRWDMSPFDGLYFNTSFAPPPQEPLALTKKDGDGTPLSNRSIGAIVVVIAFVIIAVIALGVFVCKRRKAYQAFPSINEANDDSYSGSLQFEFRAIEVATSNFHESNKLGQGGFGEVYKGKFPNGTEVAVKRLSKNSGQGEQEFKNEVLLVAKLQHKNLVRLLGFSVQGEEKILVYEFVPNKSLDYFLFGYDPIKRGQLDWTKRYNIIGGITRGILYLHQDSRLTIIHRDLKASNILLDENMNPKIADFGMARNFTVDQTEGNTRRVVGTFGYMPPEYAANGQFSMKSDVYSFGVLILEIICGKMNSRFHKIDGSRGNLVTHVWRLWNNESLLELIDPTIGENYDEDEVIRCIHIGLLCVQENPTDRPTMSTIFQMLTNTSITLPVPQPPGFFFKEKSEPKDKSEPKPLAETLLPGPSTSSKSSISFSSSVDEAQITTVTPR